MRFMDRWETHYKRHRERYTEDNDEHNNGASIIPIDSSKDAPYIVSVWRAFNGVSVSMTSNIETHAKTLDEAKALAEKFIETLYKLED